jgi:ABC-type lipoprotein export system ATPase subunit
MLDLRHLAKEYGTPAGKLEVLKEVTFQLLPGQFAALRGPSGCGKTTLLLATGGLLRPSAGEVNVAGQNPWNMTSAARAAFRARHVGFVFQQFHLVPYLTVLDNVLAPLLAGAVPEAVQRANSLLEKLGMGARKEHLPAALSTGERQRTALARALLREPALLLADEPTGNLDAESASIVTRSLREYAAAGHVVLMVTHDDRAAAVATRHFSMQSGQVAEARPS